MELDSLVCLGCGEELEPTGLRQIERASGTRASICPTCGCDEFRLDSPSNVDTESIVPDEATIRHLATDD